MRAVATPSHRVPGVAATPPQVSQRSPRTAAGPCSTSGRATGSSRLLRHCNAAAPAARPPTDSAAAPAKKHATAAADADAWGAPELVAAPEDLVLEPGEPGPMAPRDGPTHPADVYRCAACERPECQVS